MRLINLHNVTCIFVIVALGAIVQVSKEYALDERVQLIELGQLHVDLIAEVLLKLKGTAAGRTDRRHQLGHALLLGQRQEVAHVGGLEANEMQRATPLADLDVVHLVKVKIKLSFSNKYYIVSHKFSFQVQSSF